VLLLLLLLLLLLQLHSADRLQQSSINPNCNANASINRDKSLTNNIPGEDADAATQFPPAVATINPSLTNPNQNGLIPTTTM
jgi:hypothetical protein